MVRTKVFVGNLSFKTRETGLVSAFEAAGKVVNAQIVTRGNNRSLGYGFVEFENEDSANKAIKDLNHHTLDEREINVELAKPRPEGTQPPQQRRFNNNRGGYNQGGYRPYNSRGGYNRPRGGYNNTRGFNNRGPYRGNNRGGRGGRNNYGGPKRNIEDRQPSATSLFVTNLPFKFTDVEFANVFTEHGIKPKTAKVATRYNGRSRGYGFVEFENNADQQKALSTLDKKTVEGRELVLKIAMFAPPQPATQQGTPTQQSAPQQGTQQGTPTQSKPVTQQTTPSQPATQPTQQSKPATQPAPQQAQPAQSAQPSPKQPAQPAPAQQTPAQPATQPKQTGGSPASPATKKTDKKP